MKHRLFFDYDFHVFGIVAPEKPHKIAWRLNQIFEIDLFRESDLDVHHSAFDELIGFPLFSWHDEENITKFYLAANKHLGFYLSAEVKQADYVFQVSHNLLLSREKILLNLKKERNFQAVFEVNLNKLKHKETLVFE